MQELVALNDSVLEFAPEELIKDRKFMLDCMRVNGRCLKGVWHNEWKKDKSIVLRAVKQNGTALQFAHGELKCDNDFVLKCVKFSMECLEFVDDILLMDSSFILSALMENPKLWEY